MYDVSQQVRENGYQMAGIAPDGTPIPISARTTTGGALPVMPEIPNFTCAMMPAMVGTSVAVVGTDIQPPMITPQYLNQRLPSIVDSTPMTMDNRDCDDISKWVMDNPLLAGLVLVGAYMMFVKR